MAAIVGGSITQSFTSTATGAFPILFSGLSFSIAPIDLASMGMPGCISWVGPAQFLVALENLGGGYPQLVWGLPNAPELEGVALASQVLGVAASGALADSVTSNGQGCASAAVRSCTGSTRPSGSLEPGPRVARE